MPLYNDVELENAHNDYLEILSEVGLVGALLSASFVLWLLRNISIACLHRRYLIYAGDVVCCVGEQFIVTTAWLG